MHTSISGWIRLSLVLVAIAGTQTGCNKGWKMPGSDMFPWSRKPSESTLTGTSPSLSMPSSSTPVSPAGKNTPNQIAGNAAYNGRPSPYGPAANGASTNSFANNSASGAGTAASANGYTTGLYQTNGMNGRPGTSVASTGYGAPSGATNGYGGPTGYTAPGAAPAPGPQPSYGAPSFANTGATNGSAFGLPPSTSMPTGLPPTNAMAQGLPPTGMVSMPSPSYAPVGNHAPTNAVAAIPAAYANAGLPPQGAGSPSMPNALPGAYPSGGNSIPMPTQQAYNGPTAYRPGSVGRSTAYDFSNQGPGAVANMPPAPSAAPAAGAYPPASYPRTATEPSAFR